LGGQETINAKKGSLAKAAGHRAGARRAEKKTLGVTYGIKIIILETTREKSDKKKIPTMGQKNRKTEIHNMKTKKGGSETADQVGEARKKRDVPHLAFGGTKRSAQLHHSRTAQRRRKGQPEKNVETEHGNDLRHPLGLEEAGVPGGKVVGTRASRCQR